MKYKLSKETMSWCGRTLHRIEALHDFGQVKAGERGELSSKIAKAIRKGDIDIEVNPDIIEEESNGISFNIVKTNDYDKMKAFYDGLKAELGDVLWQLSGLCSVLGFTLEDVAQHNLDKLASRKQRDVIDGNGDTGDSMDARTFFERVALMRKYQRDYFKYRRKSDLQMSKRLENEIDAEIERVRNILDEPQKPQPQQGNLFEQ